MKVLLFFASSIFLLFNTDSIYNVLNDEVKTTIQPTKEINYSTYQHAHQTHNEDDILEDNDPDDIASNDDVQDSHYISDNNPITWDEDPNNYPLETPETYHNVDDEEVQSPTHYNNIPFGACAICRDGSYSFSKNRRGTCSRHGGVAQWLK